MFLPIASEHSLQRHRGAARGQNRAGEGVIESLISLRFLSLFLSFLSGGAAGKAEGAHRKRHSDRTYQRRLLGQGRRKVLYDGAAHSPAWLSAG